MSQALGVYMPRPAASISKFLRIVSLQCLGIVIFPHEIFSSKNHQEHVYGPDPQGFSGFAPSSPSATVGNRLHRKRLSKVERPSFFLQLYPFCYLQNLYQLPCQNQKRKPSGPGTWLAVLRKSQKLDPRTSPTRTKLSIGHTVLLSPTKPSDCLPSLK